MKALWGAAAIVIAIALSLTAWTQWNMPQIPLTIGITGGWGTLHPALQHSAYGDCVLTNQFEPLLRTGRNGVIEPLAAKSWEISPDRRVYRFTIDVKRRFSDGSRLKAGDFKRSWEEGVNMAPISSNSAGLDVLGGIVGFSHREKAGAIEGIRALSDEVLEIEFASPVRMVLEHLCGVRFAAFKMSRGRPIGTGTHVLIGKGRTLTMRPNPHYAIPNEELRALRMIEIRPEDVLSFLESGRIDGALFASTSYLGGRAKAGRGKIRILYGQEANHVMVATNGLPGRTLSDRRLRQAIQALIWRKLTSNGVPEALAANHFVLDPQSLLAFQAGRLSAASARRKIDEGSRHIPDLIKSSLRHPLRVVSGRDVEWLISLLRDSGVSIAENSGKLPFDEILRIIYKTHSADLLYGSFTVDNGDPDGLYHILGKDGAIHSPMMARPRVEALMGAGRSLLDAPELDPHYRKVSEAILEDVPYIHLGYSHETIAFNSDRIAVAATFASRNNSRVTIFQPL